MSIPKLNGDGVLPPYDAAQTSVPSRFPYRTTTLELCQRFGGTSCRRAILKGYLDLRAKLTQVQLDHGWQWVSGDFLDDEHRRPKPPDHIQVVTFCDPIVLDDHPETELLALLFNREQSLQRFKVDHINVYLTYQPEILIHHTQHWSERLSHQRETGIRRGFLRIDLHTPSDDHAALTYLDSHPTRV
jgi:hypothetical protein